MKNEKLLGAIGKIDDNLIYDAINDAPKKKKHVWLKVGATAACFCLILGGIFLMQDNTPTPLPSVGDDNPISTSPQRGNPIETTDATEPSTPVETGEKINVYKVTPVDIDTALINEIQTGLKAAGWDDTECTWLDDSGFVLKGTTTNVNNNLSSDECLELAKSFLSDSDLDSLFERLEMPSEFAVKKADDLNIAYCYFTCEGERTGAYIRFIFEDYKCIGEVQARLFSSECIDALPLLTLDEALVNAKEVGADGNLVTVDAADYSIKNEELVYINGLPYYRFDGYGINIRRFINGYALAVDISASEISEQLTQQYLAFRIN